MNLKGVTLKLEHLYGKAKLAQKKTINLPSIKVVRKLMVSDEGINLS